MIRTIERYIAKRRERRYRLAIADLYSFDVEAFCARCGKRVDTPKDQARLRKWFYALNSSETANSPRSALRWPENDHQCEDLK